MDNFILFLNLLYTNPLYINKILFHINFTIAILKIYCNLIQLKSIIFLLILRKLFFNLIKLNFFNLN